VTEHDVLVGFRLRLFTRAEELGNVSAACRAMGVDRSTYYRLKAKVDRWGLEALNVREWRRPRMPNQIGPHLEQRIIAFALGHPSYGPRRISAELAREKWGGLRISEHGVWRVLVRVVRLRPGGGRAPAARAMYLLGHTDQKLTMGVYQQVLDMAGEAPARLDWDAGDAAGPPASSSPAPSLPPPCSPRSPSGSPRATASSTARPSSSKSASST